MIIAVEDNFIEAIDSSMETFGPKEHIRVLTERRVPHDLAALRSM
jgi:hypothetical protein